MPPRKNPPPQAKAHKKSVEFVGLTHPNGEEVFVRPEAIDALAVVGGVVTIFVGGQTLQVTESIQDILSPPGDDDEA